MSQATSHVNELAVLLSGGDCPAIAVSFADQVSDDDLLGARRDGLDIAELRIDRYSSFDPAHVVGHVKRFAMFPTIATIRSQHEGGDWVGSEGDRLALFRAVLPDVDGIDIELSSTEIRSDVIREAAALGKVVIVSTHDFDHTPTAGELLSMATEAKSLGADLVKVAAMAHSMDDLRTLADFTLHNADQGLIVIGMGGHGSMSRAFFPALGSRLTYAMAPAGPPVPGQLSFEATFDHLQRFYPAFKEKKLAQTEALEP